MKLVCVLFNWVGVLTAGDGWSHLVPVCGLGVGRFLDHGTQGFPPSTDGHVSSLPLTVGAFPLSPAASVSMAATVSCCCLPPMGTVPLKPAARRGLALSKLSEAVVNREPGAVGNHTGPVLAPSVGENHPQGTLIDLDNFMVLCGETQRWCTTPKKGNTQLLGNYIQNNMCLECMGSLCECLLH